MEPRSYRNRRPKGLAAFEGWPIVSYPHIALALGKSTETVKRWRKKGFLPAPDFLGSQGVTSSWLASNEELRAKVVEVVEQWELTHGDDEDEADE